MNDSACRPPRGRKGASPLLAAALGLATLGVLGSSTTQAAAPPVLAILTSGEPETQGMALVLLTQMIKAGAPTQMLLCGPGGDLALKEPPATVTAPLKPRDVSPQAMLGGLMAAGAQVQVCALYLPNKGLGSEALVEGVTVAQPPDIAARMLATDVRVFNF